MIKVLVTGGAGYIGSHVVKRLAGERCHVVVYDNLSTGFRENVTYGRLVVGDLNDRALLNRVMKRYKFDAVMHFAASIAVSESVENPLRNYLNNVANTMNLLGAMNDNGINKIIFSSTAAVYGADNPHVNEDSSLAPINPYGQSKLMVEKILGDLSKAGQMNHVILRYFNAIGAAADGTLGDRKEKGTHILGCCFRAARSGDKPFSVMGTDYNTPDGTCVRDYINVEDIAEAHVLALCYLLNNNPSDVFNCGYGHGYSVLEFVDTVKKITGVDFSVAYADRRPGDIPELTADSSKIRAKLGWNPRYDNLEDTIHSAWEWERKKHYERSFYGYSQTV